MEERKDEERKGVGEEIEIKIEKREKEGKRRRS